jgi:hypothetical protein
MEREVRQSFVVGIQATGENECRDGWEGSDVNGFGNIICQEM